MVDDKAKSLSLQSAVEASYVSSQKFINNLKINKIDVKNILSYYHVVFENDKDNYNRFFNYLQHNRDLIIPSSLSLLIYNIYKNEKLNLKEPYALFRNILTEDFGSLKEHIRNKYSALRSIVYENVSVESFKNTIKETISKCYSFDYIESRRKAFCLDVDMKIFLDAILPYIDRNYENEKIFNEYVKPIILDGISLINKKYIYRVILIKLLNQEKLPEHWIINIRRELGHPEDKSNSKWEHLFPDPAKNKEIKDKFRELINSIELHNFFEKLIADKDRLNFWKNYIPSIYRAETVDMDSLPFIMEFERHTFIEFGKVGNALYVYRKDDIDIEKAKKMYDLKKRRIAVLWFAHNHRWQSRLKDKLAQMGYYPNK